MDFKTGLTAIDYLVIVVMLMVPLGIGILFAYIDRNRTTREEYLMGGRKMSVIPVAVSLFATFQSSISMIGVPAEIYNFGSMTLLSYIGASLTYIVGYFIMTPVLYPLKLTSLYEYILLRFESRPVRLFSAVIGMFQTLFYMAIALLSPAVALQTAASIPLWLSVAIVGMIGTVYTAIGGIKSVVWTDAFQTFIVFTGIMMVVAKGAMSVGGVGESWDLASGGGRLFLDVISPDPRTRHSLWGMIFGIMFTSLTNVFNQSTIQRISSMPTKREAGICFLLNIPMALFYGVVMCATGIVMYAYFSYHQCDPAEGGLLTSGNQIFPFYVMHVLRDIPGMSGFFMAALFSGGLSTLSSGINALAANTVEDLLQTPLRGVRETRVTFLTKMVVFLYGLVIVGLAYLANSIQGPVSQTALSVFGACGSPVVGMFLMGILFPWANKYGALAGGISAITFNVFLTITGQRYGRKPMRLPPVSTKNCFQLINSTSVVNFTQEHRLTTSVFENYLRNSTPVVNANILSSTESLRNPHDYTFFLFDISYEWYGVIGIFTCLFVGLIVSYLTRRFVKTTPKPELLLTFSRCWYSPYVTYDVKLQTKNSSHQHCGTKDQDPLPVKTLSL